MSGASSPLAPLRPRAAVDLGRGVIFGPSQPLGLIAGPCVLEGRDVVMRAAEALKTLSESLKIPFVFKSSYEKDNRSAAGSYRGPGLDDGLALLAEVKASFEVPVLSDVHRPADITAAAEVLDVIQIPAFLCRQTLLLEAAGRSGRVVHVKKGQFMAPEDMAGPVGKLLGVGCTRILLCERGTTFGYHTLVNDMAAIPLMRALGAPVVFDATHSVRRLGDLSAVGGIGGLVKTMSRCGVAAGCDVLFLETHPDPAQALCDGQSQVPLAQLPALLREAVAMGALVRELGR